MGLVMVPLSLPTALIASPNAGAFFVYPNVCAEPDGPAIISRSTPKLSKVSPAFPSGRRCSRCLSPSSATRYGKLALVSPCIHKGTSSWRSNSMPSASIGAMQAISNQRVDDAIEERGAIAADGMSMIMEKEAVRVPRVFNRALGNILSTGDKLGGVMRGTSSSRGKPMWKPFAPSSGVSQELDGEDTDMGAENQEEEEDEVDEDDDSRDVEELLSESNRLGWRRLGQKRRNSDTNRLLRARTEASAAVVVDGPYSKLQEYMNLPVSEYSLLDSSIIQRLSETAFRLEVPLRDFGLDFTPTVDVEVTLDPITKAVVFRSTRSTLYGSGSGTSSGSDKVETAPWPGAPSTTAMNTSSSAGVKIEYFRVSFDARLRWADGDASKAPRPRGGPKFRGDVQVARRPRPSSSQNAPIAVAAKTATASMGTEGTKLEAPAAASMAGAGAARVRAGSVANVSGAVAAGSSAEVKGGVEPATVFCDAGVKVQVLLPPPYNVVLPWRLVRALLGKVLSTTVRYMLPKFLELLADDFYKWQQTPGRPSVAVTRGSNDGTFAMDDRQGIPVAEERPRRVSRRGGKRGDGGRNASDPATNPVMGGFQRLRNVRAPGTGRTGRVGVGVGAEEGAATVVRRTTADRAPAPALQDWPVDDGVSRGVLQDVEGEKVEEVNGKDDEVEGRRKRGEGAGKSVAGVGWRAARWRRRVWAPGGGEVGDDDGDGGQTIQGGGDGSEDSGGGGEGPVVPWWG